MNSKELTIWILISVFLLVLTLEMLRFVGVSDETISGGIRSAMFSGRSW